MRIFWLVLCSFLAVSLTACRQGRVPPDGMPKLYRCVFQMTQEGTPLEDAIVTLHPVSESLAWTVSGKTDAAGKAEIFTHGYFKGAPFGSYNVTVRKTKTVSPPLPDPLPTGEAARTRLYNRIEEETRDYDLVDLQYISKETTPLKLTVEKKMPETAIDVGKEIYELAR